MSTDIMSQDDIDDLLNYISDEVVEDRASKLKNKVITKKDKKIKKIKEYDFKRPDKFSKENTRTVRMLHETFCRLTTTSLSAQLRTLVQVHVVTVDQLTYEEFIRSVTQTTILAEIQLPPLHGRAIIEIDPTITFTIIERLFGGSAIYNKTDRDITEIEQSVMESIIIKMLSNIKEAWSQVIDLRPSLVNIETNAQFAQIVPPNEMIILVTLEVRIGDIEGMMNFCYPYITLESIMSKLSAEFFYTAIRKGFSTESFTSLKERLFFIDVNIIVEIGKLNITLKEVISLKPGDFIRLPKSSIDDIMSIKIEDKIKFLGKPGLVGKRISVKITKQLEEISEEDFLEGYNQNFLDNQNIF